MRSRRRYEIRVGGHLDDHWAAWLGGVETARDDDGTTTIVAVLDDAAVHGLLARLGDLGVTLLALRSTTPTDGEDVVPGS